MQGFHSITFNHIYRETNQRADFWAKKGATTNEEFILLNSRPVDVSPLLDLDCRGFALSRFVNS